MSYIDTVERFCQNICIILYRHVSRSEQSYLALRNIRKLDLMLKNDLKTNLETYKKISKVWEKRIETKWQEILAEYCVEVLEIDFISEEFLRNEEEKALKMLGEYLYKVENKRRKSLEDSWRMEEKGLKILGEWKKKV